MIEKILFKDSTNFVSAGEEEIIEEEISQIIENDAETSGTDENQNLLTS